jgi:hypothetical protein
MKAPHAGLVGKRPGVVFPVGQTLHVLAASGNALQGFADRTDLRVTQQDLVRDALGQPGGSPGIFRAVRDVHCAEPVWQWHVVKNRTFRRHECVKVVDHSLEIAVPDPREGAARRPRD